MKVVKDYSSSCPFVTAYVGLCAWAAVVAARWAFRRVSARSGGTGWRKHGN